jgi:hypothetical protein
MELEKVLENQYKLRIVLLSQQLTFQEILFSQMVSQIHLSF